MRALFKAILIFPILFMTAKAQESDLLADLDLPLMAGLIENQDAAMLFDSPDGRIVNAEAAGNIKSDDITNYYKGVLPALGWSILGGSCEALSTNCILAERENEKLSLNLFDHNGGSRITFALSPK